jgi:hypothetical protein
VAKAAIETGVARDKSVNLAEYRGRLEGIAERIV